MTTHAQKRVTYINTEDGRTAVEWWEKEHFTGRSTLMYTGEVAEAYLLGAPLDGLVPEAVIPIPNDSIVCDFCNEPITKFPVPVVFRYALCPKCYRHIQK
jgi:hypothetical protein